MRTGIGVSKGYAIGIAYVISGPEKTAFRSITENPVREAERLKAAVELSKNQVQKIAVKTKKTLDKKNTEIVESHLNFLNDPAFIGEAFQAIRNQSVTAEKAISDITESLCRMFSDFDDEYTRERAADIEDVGERILENLQGKNKDVDFQALPANTVLFAHELKPSDTARIDKKKIIALVTEVGGKTSHTAILAKALGIAAVVGYDGILQKIKTGMQVIVDGSSGSVILSPDRNTLQKYGALQEDYRRQKEQITGLSGVEIHSKEGKRILVEANIGNLDDLKTALENNADGVGLFRTEFLYMGRQTIPSEDEQFRIYREAAELLDGKPLTIRTLDIGGDKSLPYLSMPKESNPFLGLRAIRLCLKNPELFKTQLRAILRASAFGNIRIMFPMISNIRELEQAKEILDKCKGELQNAGIAYNADVKTGMMVEIPSAALLASDFAKRVDFFSIGTNDLTQYTLAVDRMNETISGLYDSMNPAVLKLIDMTISAAHKASIPCCMCGELASDEKAIPLLLQAGLDEFSVSPGVLGETRNSLLHETGR